MWHQSGSGDWMEWDEVKEWVEDLNSKGGYAGYDDWRLPTLEEAASLLESSKVDGGLYIDRIFSNKQEWIWTGDSKAGSEAGSEAAWYVYFGHGRVRWILLLLHHHLLLCPSSSLRGRIRLVIW
jgi:hypothetical protein